MRPTQVDFPELHLEITSKCALKCPQCPRTYHLDKINITSLPLDVIQSIVAEQTSFEFVILCGDHGDPIYHPQFFEVINLLKKIPGEPAIVIATNGSFRPKDWWQELAQKLSPRDRVIFGIDGLEDTNPIYRVGSNWSSIMQAIQTLKHYGRCQIWWQWILFGHNEHQLKDGALFARQLGVDKFLLVDSPRFDLNDPMTPKMSLKQAQQNIEDAL